MSSVEEDIVRLEVARSDLLHVKVGLLKMWRMTANPIMQSDMSNLLVA